jgi:TRAP transporter 4TM/12TM fusion protein
MNRFPLAAHWFSAWNALAAGLLTFFAFALAFNLGSTFRIAYYEEQVYALSIGLAMFLTFHRPPRPGTEGKPERSVNRAWVEGLVGWVILLASIAFAWRFASYSIAIVTQPPEIVIGGGLMILALLEAVRRMAGISLVIVIIVIFGYTLFGQYLPPAFAAPETDLGATIAYVVGDPNAILGSPIAVAVVVVIPFIFMGEVLRISAGSSFFTDIAMAMVGKAPGGSAKVAVVSSGLFGTISGSAVANVVGTGVITIPLMKSGGYSAEKAGAVEAVASTGGQLVPPVMGAAAFLMAEFLQISYAEVVLAAIIPSLLYYGSLFLAVHLIAKRDGIGGVNLESRKAAQILKSGWFFLAGLVALLALLLTGKARPEEAAFVAAVFFALCGMVIGYRGARMKVRDCVTPIMTAGQSSVDILVISAAAGIVVGLLNVSGLSFSLSLFLIQLASNNAFLLLLYTAIVSIILGMGMPTTGVYVLLAAVVAPALIQLGTLPLAAHFFIFYFGMLSMITPPVAMAAYAGASIAGGDPMKTGWTAMLIGWPAFVLPFLMAETNALLFVGPLHLVLVEGILAAVGVAAVTAGGMGYWNKPLSLVGRAIWLLAGIFCLLSVIPGDYVMPARVAVGLLLLAWMTGLGERLPIGPLRRVIRPPG